MAKHSDEFTSNTRMTTVEINNILEQFDSYIQSMARTNFPRGNTLAGELTTEIEDFAQSIRCSLWQSLQKREIWNLKGYIRTIAYHERVNIVRRREPTIRITKNEEGELPLTYTLVAASQEMYDPTQNIEEEEVLESYASNLPEHVVKLPRQQRYSMINSLKERISELLPLVDMFKSYDIDIESLNWPEDPKELHSSRVSLIIAQKKLRLSMKSEKR